jgi:hypothetical protein
VAVAEAVELAVGSSSIERGRLDDSATLDRGEIEVSSTLRGMVGFRLMEGGELEVGDEV